MSVPVEPLDIINRRLKDFYGETDNLPNYRIVYSETELEKVLSYFTKEGIALLHPIVIEKPKYKQWIHNKHVLEQLSVVPQINSKELLGQKLSYEPLWVFEDQKGNPLPPAWGAAKFLIDGVRHTMEHGSVYTRYPDHNESKAEKEEYLKSLEAELYANESNVGDALATKNAISMAGLDGRSKES